MNGASTLAALGRTIMPTTLARKRSVLIVRDFMRRAAPFDIAACMYHTGFDPFTKQEA